MSSQRHSCLVSVLVSSSQMEDNLRFLSVLSYQHSYAHGPSNAASSQYPRGNPGDVVVRHNCDIFVIKVYA